jgi:hypothetical protein
MDAQDVRTRADALCAALVSGDVDEATTAFSAELRRNLGEVLALLPLPATDVTIVSMERAGASGAFVVVLELVGETETVQVQTRWKERDGRPTVIEASHLNRAEREPAPDEEGSDEEGASEATA